MAFFGPGGLSGATSQPQLDPMLMEALLAQFPGLQSLGQGQGQQDGGRTLQSLGYQWGGPTLYAGQGQGSFNLSPFESAGGASPESITGGLAQGTFGKSSSQTPVGSPSFGQGDGGSTLSLPSLQLPMAQVNALAGGGQGDSMSGGGQMVGGEQAGGGFNVGLQDVLGAGQQIAGLFSPGTGTAFDPGQRMQQPDVQQQRAGERDLSTLGGSFLQPSAPGSFPNVQSPASLSSLLQPGFDPSTTFSMGAPENFGVTAPLPAPQTLSPGTTFEMPGQGTTMSAPGGSAATALGSTGGPDFSSLLSMGNLGSATDLLSGLYGLYSGVQGKDPQGALLSTLQAYQGLQPLFNQVAGSPALPSVNDIGMKGLQSIAPDLAASLSGQIAGMTPAQSAAALGELGVNTSASGLGSLAGSTTGAGAGALVSAALQQLMSATGARPGDMQSASKQLMPLLMGVGGAAGGVGAALAGLYEMGDYLFNADAAKSGSVNNPIKAQLYGDATAGVSGANQTLDQLFAGGGLAGQDTFALLSSLPGVVDSLLPYYSTGQGGVKALRASDAAPDQGAYTQDFTNAQSRVGEIIKELMNRGVSYEQLGQLGVSPSWSGMSLDAGGRPEEFYARGRDQYAATVPHWSDVTSSSRVMTRGQNVDPSAPGYEAKVAWDEADRYQPEYSIRAPENMFFNDQGFSPHVGTQSFTPWAYAGGGVNGSPLDMSAFNPDNTFLAALGAAGYNPNAMTPQQQTQGMNGQPDVASMQGVASMYGGPLWQAVARMGLNDFTPMIQQNFNPWATWSGMSGDQRLDAMGPSVLGPMQMNKDAGIFGGGSGVALNPRLGDTFSGLNPSPLPAQGFTPTWQGAPLDLNAMALQQDPMLQQLLQFNQGMGQFNQQAPQLLQAAQQDVQGAPVSGVIPGGGAPQMGGDAQPQQSGGGLDLWALLRQMGYVQ